MVKYLICSECGVKTLARHIWVDGVASPYEGEYVMMEAGMLKPRERSYECDLCGQPLAVGGPAYALSVWTESRPYAPWEDEFLTRSSA